MSAGLGFIMVSRTTQYFSGKQSTNGIFPAQARPQPEALTIVEQSIGSDSDSHVVMIHIPDKELEKVDGAERVTYVDIHPSNRTLHICLRHWLIVVNTRLQISFLGDPEARTTQGIDTSNASSTSWIVRKVPADTKVWWFFLSYNCDTLNNPPTMFRPKDLLDGDQSKEEHSVTAPASCKNEPTGKSFVPSIGALSLLTFSCCCSTRAHQTNSRFSTLYNWCWRQFHNPGIALAADACWEYDTFLETSV